MHEVNHLFEIVGPKSIWGSFFLFIIGILVGTLVVLNVGAILTFFNLIEGGNVNVIGTLILITTFTIFLGIPPWEFFHIKKIGSLSIFIGTYIGAIACTVLWYVRFYT